MKRVLITGTGRTGTTFLIHLLTALNFDTGFPLSDCEGARKKPCRAGLDAWMNWNHKILKNPYFSLHIRDYVTTGVEIEHVIIPIRSLDLATKSRVNQGRGDGGFWGTGSQDYDSQKRFLLEVSYNLIYDLTEFDIPYTIIHFPRFVEDALYLKQKLDFLLHDIEKDRFKKVFSEIADPSLITQKETK
jgi:hypothetical protein